MSCKSVLLCIGFVFSVSSEAWGNAPACHAVLTDPIEQALTLTFQNRNNIRALKEAARDFVKSQDVIALLAQHGKGAKALPLSQIAGNPATVAFFRELLGLTAALHAENVLLGSQIFHEEELQDSLQQILGQVHGQIDPNWLMGLATQTIQGVLEARSHEVFVAASEQIKNATDTFQAELKGFLETPRTEDEIDQMLQARPIHRDMVNLFERSLRVAQGENLKMGFGKP